MAGWHAYSPALPGQACRPPARTTCLARQRRAVGMPPAGYSGHAAFSVVRRFALRLTTIFPKRTKEPVVTRHKRPNRENLDFRCRGARRLPVGRGGHSRQRLSRRLQRVVDACGDGPMHVCLLLPEIDALPDASCLRWDLCTVLLQVDALPDASCLRRHLRALLSQADALPLHSDCSARVLRIAVVRRRWKVSKVAGTLRVPSAQCGEQRRLTVPKVIASRSRNSYILKACLTRLESQSSKNPMRLDDAGHNGRTARGLCLLHWADGTGTVPAALGGRHRDCACYFTTRPRSRPWLARRRRSRARACRRDAGCVARRSGPRECWHWRCCRRSPC